MENQRMFGWCENSRIKGKDRGFKYKSIKSEWVK